MISIAGAPCDVVNSLQLFEDQFLIEDILNVGHRDSKLPYFSTTRAEAMALPR